MILHFMIKRVTPHEASLSFLKFEKRVTLEGGWVMGKQTYVVLQCCACHMFQAQIDKASRSFNCNICHQKQPYSRVFAKSNLAKDLRPLVAEYNARGVAELEAANAAEEAEQCSPSLTDPERDREAGEMEAPQRHAVAIGDAWDEFADDSDSHKSEDREVHAECSEPEERRAGWHSSNPPRIEECSDWQRDSDARRMAEHRSRFAKRPRQKRRTDASGRAVAGRVGDRHVGEGGDPEAGCAGVSNGGNEKNTWVQSEGLDDSENRNERGPGLLKRDVRSTAIDTTWGAFLSDDE